MNNIVIKKESEEADTKVDDTKISSQSGVWQRLTRLVEHYLAKYQILNFMVVGGIGYFVNMAFIGRLLLF